MGDGILVELAYVIDAGCCATDFVADPRPDPTWPPLWPCVQPCHVSEEDDLRNLGQVHNSLKISYGGAACKTLIDSERRKNTQASNDVRARQLVRF